MTSARSTPAPKPSASARLRATLVRLARAFRRHLRTARALPYLLVAAATGRPVYLWIGDSNAVGFNVDDGFFLRPVSTKFVVTNRGQFIWHLGPRLMWSVAHKGLPPAVHRLARLLRRISRGNITPVFSFGEIDVRSHLVARVDDPDFNLDFVRGYVQHCQQIAAELGASRFVVATPTPPSAACPITEEFPIRGTLEDRIAMFQRVRAELHTVTDSFDSIPVGALLDASDLISGEDGGMLTHLTRDGVHTDPEGARRIHQRLAEVERRFAAASRNAQSS